MSHPTYCWPVSLDRCDRCDLPAALEGFHLVTATRPECALVLDIESCDRCAGCPGCGLNRSRSRARGGEGDRRALGPGPWQGSGGTMRTDAAGARELTGIADHSREGSSNGPLEWTWCRAGLAPCTRTGWLQRSRCHHLRHARDAGCPQDQGRRRHRRR